MVDAEKLKLVEDRQALELVPTWEAQGWWYLAGAAIIVLIISLFIYSRRNKNFQDPDKEKREAYKTAQSDFAELGEMDPRGMAVGVSLILRGYLARTVKEPALFETHEEFIGRHDSLAELPDDVREETSEFFSKLAELKYGPGKEADPDLAGTDGDIVDVHPVAEGIKAEGKTLLERIHAA
ncbi:hypothetical protein ACFSSA_11030 [Luteolibacter algae]|uniref:DUF4381 domain-containing protein n=2 Tax=Luteolibacter algae TaxID=454151 RepID=A0ABW5D9G7_9BACT